MDAAEARRGAAPAPPAFDWRLPLRVLRLARRVGVSPWEALAWLEAVLADFESQASWYEGGAGDGLPWPPGAP